MKKKMVIALLCMTMVIGTAQVTYADPVDSTGSVESTENAGDAGYQTINDYDTHKSTDTPALVTIKLNVPDGFSNECEATLTDGNGTVYHYSLTVDNDYTSAAYVPEGDYTIDNINVVDDAVNAYPFDFDQSAVYTADADGTTALEYDISNWDKVQKEIDKNLSKFSGSKGTDQIVKDQILYPAGKDGVYLDDAGKYYYAVDHKGDGKVEMSVSGNANQDADVICKVVKSGVIGEAKIALSLDGGKTYPAETTTADSVPVSALGIDLNFSAHTDNDLLNEGDTYNFKVYEDYNTTSSGNMDQGYVAIYGHLTDDRKITINILSSGGRGVSRFNYTYNDVTSDTQVIPEDGIYQSDVDGLTFAFSDSDYAKDLSFTADIECADKKINWTPLIVFGVIAVVGLIGAYIYMMGKRDKTSDYQINVYDAKQEDKYYED